MLYLQVGGKNILFENSVNKKKESHFGGHKNLQQYPNENFNSHNLFSLLK
jgi:hypothetical protein